MTEHEANTINTRSNIETVNDSVKKMRRHYITDEELMAEIQKRKKAKKKSKLDLNDGKEFRKAHAHFSKGGD